ncbi:hypothetical protein O6H91_16G041200 [Diphasiastrum complanatum]|uniref:Uncharacterized protein n=1 Tax=Diphasiastrum complanatum TaxID=34168 RepID=A0ACC2BBU7_DIPCM|nr:hypothetical protein O6H91_16G041200 [Diphasiastrum complanatum]
MSNEEPHPEVRLSECSQPRWGAPSDALRQSALVRSGDSLPVGLPPTTHPSSGSAPTLGAGRDPSVPPSRGSETGCMSTKHGRIPMTESVLGRRPPPLSLYVGRRVGTAVPNMHNRNNSQQRISWLLQR